MVEVAHIYKHPLYNMVKRVHVIISQHGVSFILLPCEHAFPRLSVHTDMIEN